ncbi:hypothetical protein BDR03DRAFT_962259 [Suillus americanus]|nr:hypothetical protein BDR03DRAFT_962259 [Suillus americanus]
MQMHVEYAPYPASSLRTSLIPSSYAYLLHCSTTHSVPLSPSTSFAICFIVSLWLPVHRKANLSDLKVGHSILPCSMCFAIFTIYSH